MCHGNHELLCGNAQRLPIEPCMDKNAMQHANKCQTHTGIANWLLKHELQSKTGKAQWLLCNADLAWPIGSAVFFALWLAAPGFPCGSGIGPACQQQFERTTWNTACDLASMLFGQAVPFWEHACLINLDPNYVY